MGIDENRGMMKKIFTLLVIAFLITQSGLTVIVKADKTASFTPASKEVKVYPLAVYGEDTPDPYGKAHLVKVTVKPNKSGKLRVGFFEEEVAGTGSQWRSAGWMAAITGTYLLGLNLADYNFTFDVTGRIDGPSAGALMTVAVLASLLGDNIKKDVTMTGTINPDGTIGPVGGIPQKIGGAKKAGKKVVLIPTGQRFSIDLKTQETADVVSLGRQKGVTVREVADIFTAYKQLTGESLPQPKVSDTKPGLSARTFDKIKGKSNEWYSKYTKIKADYDAVNPQYKTPELDNLMADAANFADRSNAYLDQGLIAPSYDEAIFAVIFADFAYQGAKIIETYLNGGIEGAKNYLEASKSSWLETDAMLDRLKSEKPRSLSDVIALVDAYGLFSSAVGLGVMGDNELEQPAENEEQTLTNMAGAATAYSLAGHILTETDDTLDIGLGAGTEKEPNKKLVGQLSEALRRAAEANLEYFDNVVLTQKAQEEGISLELMRQAFANEDLDYAFASSAIEVLPQIKKEVGRGTASNYATLGNSLQSFSLSSGLIAKYYSVGIETDENGDTIGLRHEKALINMLDVADEKAAENINLAKKLKTNPALPTFHYETGKILREGDLDEKMDALLEFWSASTQARLLAMLSGENIIGSQQR